MPPDEAIKTAIGIYEAQKNREGQLERAKLLEQGKDARFARRGAGGPPSGAPSQKNLESAFDNVQSIISSVSSNFKPAASHSNRRDLMAILDLIESPNALDQRAAIGQKVKMISGAAATDKEREYYIGSSGFWSRMENMANDYMSKGELATTLRDQLRSHALMMLQHEERNRGEAFSAANARLDTVPNIDEATRERHRQALRSFYNGEAAPPAPSGGQKAQAPAPEESGETADQFLEQ
jgi:hypothetical protein